MLTVPINDILILRNMDDRDMPLFKKWLYVPHVAKWYYDPLDWIDEIEKRNNEYKWLHHYMVDIAGESVGFCQYYEYCNSGEDWHGDTQIEGTYSIDYMIGDTHFLGKGYGKEIIKSLLNKIRAISNTKRVIVQPDLKNKASCSILLSCGFNFDEINEIYLMDL